MKVRRRVVKAARSCDDWEGDRPTPPPKQIEVRGVKFPFVPVLR